MFLGYFLVKACAPNRKLLISRGTSFFCFTLRKDLSAALFWQSNHQCNKSIGNFLLTKILMLSKFYFRWLKYILLIFTELIHNSIPWSLLGLWTDSRYSIKPPTIFLRSLKTIVTKSLYFSKKRINNPATHLRWSVLRK